MVYNRTNTNYKFNRHQLDELKFVKDEDSITTNSIKDISDKILPQQYKEFDTILYDVFNRNLVAEYLDSIDKGDIIRDYYGIGKDKVSMNSLAHRLGMTSDNVKRVLNKAIGKLKDDREFKEICIKSFGE